MEIKNLVKKIPTNTPVIIPIGGCGEFGMNATIFHYNGQSILVDAGVMFADPYLLGVDGLIPNAFELIDALGEFLGYVITHGHEDHIGGLPVFLQKRPAPVYANRWTEELIKRKLARWNLDEDIAPIIQVVHDQIYQLGPFSFKYFPVNHSIPMTCSLLMEVGGKRIFHTGDFKLDLHSTFEPPVDLTHLKKICAGGVDLLLADSTNATSPGTCGSESKLHAKMEELFKKTEGRIFVTTFSSNLWRLISIIKAAQDSHRRIYIAGLGMQTTLEIAVKMRMLDIDPDILVTVDQLSYLTPRQSLVLISGCQGEYRSALTRLANDELPKIGIVPGDTVIFSSRIIPGNEKTVIRIINKLLKREAHIITAYTDRDIHVSGHAFADEIDLLFKTIQPKSFIPVHGNFTQMKANYDIGSRHIRASESLHLPENGNVICLQKNNSLKLLEHVDIDALYVDGYSKAILDRDALRPRMKIGEMGSVFFSAKMRFNDRIHLDDCQLTYHGIGLPKIGLPNDPQFEQFEEKLINQVERNLNGAFKAKDELSLVDLSEFVRLAIRSAFMKVMNKKIVVSVHLHVDED